MKIDFWVMGKKQIRFTKAFLLTAPLFCLSLAFLGTGCSSKGGQEEGRQIQAEQPAGEPLREADEAPEETAPNRQEEPAPVGGDAGALGEGGLNVIFIYPSPVGDAGWTKAHDEGRKLVDEMPGVSATYVESVLGNDYMESIITSVSRDNGVVFTAGFEYMDATIKVAEQFPDVIYMHCSGYKRSQNVGTYFGRMYLARYLSGIVAGSMSKNNEVGFVAAFPIPEVIRGINAFALGAQSVNPDIKVYVAWTKTWYNPNTEKEAALGLIEKGVDVLAQHQDSAAVQKAAEEAGIYSVGYNSDMSVFAPNAHLTAPIWNWGVLYKHIIELAQAGLWKSEDYWWGLKEGIVDLAPFGPMVPEEVRQKALAAKAEIIDGSLNVFQGPVFDQKGGERIGAGQVPADEELLAMDWFVKGVEGGEQ